MKFLEDFFDIADRKADLEILYVNGTTYTYQLLKQRFAEIRKYFPETVRRKILAVSTSDPVELILYYFIALERQLSYLPLPEICDSNEKEEIQNLYHMKGQMPFHGYGMVDIDEYNGSGDEVLFLTSGTSGKKRIVCLSNDALYQRCSVKNAYDENEPDTKVLLITSIWKHLGFKEVLHNLLAGIKTYVALQNQLDEAIELLKTQSISYLVLKSSLLSAILYHPHFTKECMASVQILRYCQEPLPMETLIQMQALYPRLKFFSDYGLTETLGTIALMGPELHDKAVVHHHLPTIGHFLSEVEIKLMDEKGEQIINGEVGELYVHTPWQFRGYLGQEKTDYWIPTGDMGWFDTDGYFNLSGFRKLSSDGFDGKVYVLPAIARKMYASIPFLSPSFTYGNFSGTLYQNMLALLHASMNVDEIKHVYMDMISDIISADAYGFELFPIDMQTYQWKNTVDENWYHGAMENMEEHEVFLLNKNTITSVSVQFMKDRLEGEIDILCLPLYSQNAQLHGMLSFVKSKNRGGFSSWEITLLKQLSHHVNLAVLNARIFQEIQTRQIVLQETMDFLETGMLLSDTKNVIYYMNSTVKNMMDEEKISSLHGSFLLEQMKENIYHLELSRKMECRKQFMYYPQKGVPFLLNIRSVRLSMKNKFIAHFISKSLEDDNTSFGDLEETLTKKEKEVLTCLCHGLSYKEIAEKMYVSINTVNFHIKNIYRKMNINSRNELLDRIFYLGKNGLQYVSGEKQS